MVSVAAAFDDESWQETNVCEQVRSKDARVRKGGDALESRHAGQTDHRVRLAFFPCIWVHRDYSIPDGLYFISTCHE